MVTGHFQNVFGTRRNDVTVLQGCGHAIDNGLFDLDGFGACPIYQEQAPELSGKAEEPARHDFSSVTRLRVISPADGRFLSAIAGSLAERPGPLSAQERSLFLSLAGSVELALPDRIHRENLPLLTAFFPMETLRDRFRTATDVLRTAMFLSDPAADLSLASPGRIRLRTSQKKTLLGLLEEMPNLVEEMPNLVEDMLRRREPWLRFGEVVNPGTAANRARYPKTVDAFDMVRKSPGAVPTFSRKAEKLFRARRADPALAALLTERPDELARRLDALLREPGADVQAVLAAAGKSLEKVPLRMLFVLSKHFSGRDRKEPFRAFVPKGTSTKLKVTEDRRRPIPADTVEAVTAEIDRAILARLAPLPALGSIYVARGMDDIPLPFNRRGDSTVGTGPMLKGAKTPMGDFPVARLFVWWKEACDIDLSAVLLGEDFGEVGHVSFTNLRNEGAVHSGDIVNGYMGGSEFIDLDIEILRNRKVRYVVASLICFRGTGFQGYPCFAGYMGRDSLRSGQHFEPASVEIRFDVASAGKQHMPLIFDLAERKVVFADIAGGVRSGMAVASLGGAISRAAKAVMDMTRTKPTVGDVLRAHARARGHLAAYPEEADMILAPGDIGIDDVLLMADGEPGSLEPASDPSLSF